MDNPFGDLALEAPRRYLVEGERPFLTVRHHWSLLTTAAVRMLVIWIVCITLIRWLPPSLLTDLAALALLGSLGKLFWDVLQWRRTTITVSDKRLFMLSGVLTRRLSMLPLRKVTDMTLVQPLSGRMLGYGSIIVESAGQTQALSDIHHIPRAMAFYQVLASLVFEGRTPPWGNDDTVVLDTL